MINMKTNDIATITGNGLLTLWGVYQQYKAYIHENYGWNAESTKDGHEARLRLMIREVIPNHDVTPVILYEDDFSTAVAAKMEKLGKSRQAEYQKSTLEQYEHVIHVVLEVAAAFYLRYPTNVRGQSEEKLRIHMDELPVVRRFLRPDEERAILNKIIPCLLISGQARLMLIMMACGLRENECCGLNWSMLRRDEDTGVCTVSITQTVSIGSNTTKIGGKTCNAPRVVVVYDYVYGLLMKVKKQLQRRWIAEGRTEEGIENCPLGCKENDLERRCATRDLTEYANRIFAEVGIRNDELHVLAQELVEEKREAEENGVYTDIYNYASPTCYLLRRSYATHLIALQLDSNERQYSMGHNIDDLSVDRRMYTSCQMQRELHKKLEARPLLGTVNQRETIVAVNCPVRRKGYEQRFVIPQGAKSLFVEIEAEEPGDNITVTVDAEPNQKCNICSTMTWYDPPEEYPEEINVQRYYQSLFDNYK